MNESDTAKKPINAPLTVEVSSDTLVITVGINVLAGAIAQGNAFHQFDEQRNEYVRNFAICDAHEFARDVARELQREEEDGSSPLTKLIDQVGQAAIDDGSQGVSYDQRIAFGKTMKRETWTK